MTETNEAGVGFDRRSLIKKGLVVGGIAATAPVISTFNAPAFAASPGVWRIMVHVNKGFNQANATITQRGDTPDACPTIEAQWDAAQPDPGPGEIPLSISSTTTTFTIQMGAGTAGCTFTTAQGGGGLLGACTDLVGTTGGSSTTFTRIPPVNADIFLIVTCV